MQSTNLLPALRELPTDETQGRQDARNMIRRLVETDRSMYAAEFAASISLGTWAVFHQPLVGVDINDALHANLEEAYQSAFPNVSNEYSLHERWQEMLARGDESSQGFLSNLQGKLAEIRTEEVLAENGYTNIFRAASQNQPGWDIYATAPDGTDTLFQVKSGAAEYAGPTMDAMDAAPEYSFPVSTEIYDNIADSASEITSNILDIGSAAELTSSAKDNLNLLANNMGIDVPDNVVDILPYAGAIIAGARLVYSVIKTEREFKAVDRTAKNKIQVVQSLTLMARMGINTVLATVGGTAGAAAGSFIPFVGNLIGGIGGTVAGAGMGMYLNKHLQPHMLDLALNIAELTRDDLFYYKNMALINRTACSLQQTNKELQRQKPLPALLAAPA